MRRSILYLCSWLCLAFTACSKEELPIPAGDAPASLKLSIRSSQNETKTRAVSSDDEEKLIRNLYIFVFNSDGSVDYRGYFRGLNAASTWSRLIEGVISGTGKSVAAIANTGNTVTDITREDLEAVTSQDELEQLVANIQGEYIERGTNFLMSGITENITVAANSATPVTVSLQRVDAKIRFNITTAENVTFTPSEWRVVSVPRKTGLLNAREDLCAEPGDCFDSGWAKFEENGKTFAFYSMENVVTPRALIPSEGTFPERYALREKQDKTPTGPGINVTNGAFTFAPATGTYVEMRGNVHYRTNVEISADVVYTVHLGGVDENVNDYNSLRNTYYTYNVRIVSVDKIIVEVESSRTDQEDEQRPGAEGDVTAAKYIKELDAYNEILVMTFNLSDVDESLTWNVNTPFSDGAEAENPTDFKWIRFRINNKTGNTYNDNNESFRTYSGDSHVYTGEVGLNAYMSDVANGTDKMLYVDQLVAILKASKEQYEVNESHLFDSSGKICFTVFVDENYYYTNPNNPSETAENGLWKKFVNQKERVMNILSNVTYSPDHESSKSNAVYSIRQASIQTMYNRSADILTAWGTQMIQDETSSVFNKQAAAWELTYDDPDNGRSNSINMWITKSRTRWSDYIVQNSWSMEFNYDAAKYKCLRMNRDNNGNNRVDENEVQWYLAAINQLTDIWIGEWSYDPTARLYKKTTWSTDQEQYFASSTVTRKEGIYDDPQILWSAEGSSVGFLSRNEQTGTFDKMDAPVYYRCVRNLGIPRDAESNIKPSELAHYDPQTRQISLRNLDAQSIRGYFQTDELPEHHEREAANKPYWAFEVKKDLSGKNNYTWNSLRRAIAAGNSPCPEGYRVPNQRELALMFSRIGNDRNWTLSSHFSRTRFQFADNRPGFAVSENCEVLSLTHSGTEEQSGGVRCVKDVR